MSANRTKIMVGMVLLITIGAVLPSFASGSAGGACAKAGLTTIENGHKLTCSLVWTTSSVTSKVSSAPKSKTPSSGGIQRSKGFELISIQFNDSVVISGATARVQNVTNGSLNATFVITVFASDGVTPEATLNGNAFEVAAGETQTVQFITTSGSLPTGTFKYSFQTSVQF